MSQGFCPWIQRSSSLPLESELLLRSGTRVLVFMKPDFCTLLSLCSRARSPETLHQRM